MTIRIPSDFAAVVFTPPARVDHDTVSALIEATESAGISKIKGHRILHMHQVEYIDSAAIAGLMRIAEIAAAHGAEFIACDPPPIVNSYLEIYGAEKMLSGHVLSSAQDGTYTSDLLPFVPPFVPHPLPRYDVYGKGKIQSFELRGDALHEIAPVDLSKHPPKPPARASRMAVRDERGKQAELGAAGYVLLRRHNCGCDATHSAFARLNDLHRWYRGKGFDFVGLELWAGDEPAGSVSERLTFRDRLHFDQFRTLLKIDGEWKEFTDPAVEVHEEKHFVYSNG